MNPIILIPARLASTRLPGKPLAEIAGRPMILHVLDRAREAGLGPVAVACAETEIEAAVIAAGGRAIRTDPALKSGSDRIHAALNLLDAPGAHDIVINLQGDLPGIPPEFLHAVLAPLRQENFDIATLVAPIVTAGQAASPSIVKCACAFPGEAEVAPALYFSRNPLPGGQGPLWQHIGIYAYRRAALEKFVGLAESPLESREKLEQLRALEAGMRIGAARVAAAPLGIDTPADLAAIREIMAGAA